jgi:sulfate permease, SulP family
MAASLRERLPAGVESFKLNGPFFFGAAAHFEQVLGRTGGKPKTIILDMEGVPLIDSTGAATLRKFLQSTHARGIRVILAATREGPAAVLDAMDIRPSAPGLSLTP